MTFQLDRAAGLWYSVSAQLICYLSCKKPAIKQIGKSDGPAPEYWIVSSLCTRSQHVLQRNEPFLAATQRFCCL